VGKKQPLPPGTSRIDGTDGSITFDGEFVTIKHKWHAEAGGGESRYPLASVSGVDVKNGMALATVTVVVPGGVLRKGKADPLTVKGFSKQEAAAFRDKVVRARAALNATPAAPVVQQAPAPGLGDQLAQLAALRAQGALSEAEFAAAKTQLLGTPAAEPQDARPSDRTW
jgi:hypothetical protein